MSSRNIKLSEDIYYQKEYIALYLKEDEKIFEFTYEQGAFHFYTVAIKREINKVGNIKVLEKVYDLESAYGYGGFYSNGDTDFLKKALNAYALECKKQNIISEFIRFHPFNDTPTLLDDYFDFIHHDRDTVYVDCSLSQESRWASYSCNTRNILRRCEAELTLTQSNDIDSFMKLYKTTMQRNEADDFYFFQREYFEKLLALEGVILYNVVYKEQIIASVFFMFSSEFGHYHLSANDYAYKKQNANYYLLDSFFNLASQRGIKYFHLGGGRTNDTEDSLLKFKQKFSKKTKPFYIAGKIYNKELYDRYNALWEMQSSQKISYFLKYRLEPL